MTSLACFLELQERRVRALVARPYVARAFHPVEPRPPEPEPDFLEPEDEPEPEIDPAHQGNVWACKCRTCKRWRADKKVAQYHAKHPNARYLRKRPTRQLGRCFQAKAN